MTQSNRCILSDSRNAPLAHALLESPPTAKIWQLRVLNGGVEKVLEHEYLEVVGIDPAIPAISGRIVRSRGDVIAVEPISRLDSKVRQSLRVAYRHKSLIYPVSGGWTGRRAVEIHDLSCGGAAFFCEERLEREEVVELVVPTEPPLVVKTKVLRPRTSNGELQLYACAFLDLTKGEETMICEAVFSQQISDRENSAH